MINKNAENNVESHFVEANKMGKIPDKKTPRPVGAERGRGSYDKTITLDKL